MTPQEFIAKWKPAHLTERGAAQEHFLDLCELLGQPKPAAADPEGAWYAFERSVHKTGGGQGWADVWMRRHFAWEYKRKRRNLAEAYQQLLLYRENLENPPLRPLHQEGRHPGSSFAGAHGAFAAGVGGSQGEV